jgi:accessory colonization factor AcfC
MGALMNRTFFTAAIMVAALSANANASTVHAYGPGGPAPAMKEAAAAFKARTGVDVVVTAGPTPQWIDAAHRDADVMFSGAENMMTDFVKAMGGAIDEKTIDPLYLRASNILVRPGNPRHISGLHDLLKPGVKVMVVQGAGQTGLWEDMAGRAGNVATVRALRRNIVQYAPNSAAAKQAWTGDPSIDAWIIWGIWAKANPGIADSVAVEPRYRIYRDAGTALTKAGAANPDAVRFVSFLKSAQGAAIFRKWGWMTPGPASSHASQTRKKDQ